MKKPVHSSHLALRFYKCDGWTKDILDKYVLRGEMDDTEHTLYGHKNDPANAYFRPNMGTKLDVKALYENEISYVVHFDGHKMEGEEAIEYMRRMN